MSLQAISGTLRSRTASYREIFNLFCNLVAEPTGCDIIQMAALCQEQEEDLSQYIMMSLLHFEEWFLSGGAGQQNVG